MASVSAVEAVARPRGRAPKKFKTNVFHQRLGGLTYRQACQMLGDDGADRLRHSGGRFEILFDRDVYLGGDLFRVRVEDTELPSSLAIVTLTLQSGRARQLQLNCDCSNALCLHGAAALDYLLDAKEVLGLAAAADESVPLEHLTHGELHARAIAERQKRAEEEAMPVRSTDNSRPWTDYLVTNSRSGKTYRVALRGYEAGQSYCSCPDFRSNALGTQGAGEPDSEAVDSMTQRLSALTEVDDQGRPQIKISLPDGEALRGIAATLAKLLQQPGPNNASNGNPG